MARTYTFFITLYCIVWFFSCRPPLQVHIARVTILRSFGTGHHLYMHMILYEYYYFKCTWRTGIVCVPPVYRELHVGGDGHDGRHGQLRERVGRYVTNRRVGRELHGHAHVVGYAGEHHWRLEKERQVKDYLYIRSGQVGGVRDTGCRTLYFYGRPKKQWKPRTVCAVV